MSDLPTAPLHVVMYLRVSTEEQAVQGTSIPAQRRELVAYAERQRWRIVAEFVDEGESARTDRRPEFQRMIAEATSAVKPFGAILVYDLSRFSRNRLDSGNYKFQLKKHGVSVISCSQNIGDEPEGQLLEGIIESVDEFYSQKLSVVTLRGQKEVSRRGYRVGGSAPFGYLAVKRRDGAVDRTVLKPDPYSGPIVAQMFSMRSEGASTREIATWLNERGIRAPRRQKWLYTTVVSILANPDYIGEQTFNRRTYKSRQVRENAPSEWIVVKGAHEPLVSVELFKAANAFNVPRGAQRRRFIHLLTGIARCAKCGSPIIMNVGNSRHNAEKRYFYYACRASIRVRGRSCKEPSVSSDLIDRSVLAAIRDTPLDEEAAWDAVQRPDSDPLIDRERAILAGLQRKLANIVANMLSGIVAEAVQLAAVEIEAQVIAQQSRVLNMELGRSVNLPTSREEMHARFDRLIENLHSTDRARLRGALHALIMELLVDFSGRALKIVVRSPVEYRPESLQEYVAGA